MLADEREVTLAQQKSGEAPVGSVSIQKAVFDRFVRWYTTGDSDMRKR